MNRPPAAFSVPAAYFAMVLGIIGLSNVWRHATSVWSLPEVVAEVLMCIGVLVWALLMLLYVAKWMFNRPQALAEAQHPVQCCFIGLAGVSTMLVADALLPHSRPVATALFWAGAAFTLAFGVWRTGQLWRGGREEASNTAVLYLPTVAGSFVGATSLAAFGYDLEWAQMAWGAGVLAWLALESVLLHRLLCAPALAPALRPTLGIQLAPPTVGAVAYLSVTPGAPDLLAYGLLGYGLLQALILLRNARWLALPSFVPGYWGFSFGLTAIALAALLIHGRVGKGPTLVLAPTLFVVANLGVALLAAGTLHLLARGRLFPPAEPASTAARQTG